MFTRTLAALAAFVVIGAGAAEAKDARLRFSCRANGATDISMAARYEVRGAGPGAPRKFTAEFEAAANAGFSDGQRLAVLVDGTRVGVAPLDEIATGDLVADLNFDTRPQPDASPFPSNFPTRVGRGTTVEFRRGAAVVLGCTLR